MQPRSQSLIYVLKTNVVPRLILMPLHKKKMEVTYKDQKMQYAVAPCRDLMIRPCFTLCKITLR